MAKAKDAFRTISEVAEWLDTPTHVLRFWESKFSQIKPVKGAGGRRYYRPTDMDLLGGIKQLLHEDGLTIKGTQKLLREKGVKYVAGLGQSMTDPTPDVKVAPKPAPKPAPVKAAPKPAPAAPVQDAFPFVDETPPPALQIDLPDLPTDLPDIPGRLLGQISTDTAAIREQAAAIAPLLARLEALRDGMQNA
ncbi:MerR family transcriptional regulator [Cognatiyoonia sp. IB215446]|uniref:MerR family transcriptional regulator n=1 Tax=Cognatiyoonia sp. IB215446 TaxID=3097355 RepID=UPI002A0FBFF4|nr:MerR family transcriptional regulator [Cognatiyoonia sp. IB215446]MDX8349738.1 MerR family transcriptional regulator [Cognatiyoonia sp. IB215446]